MDFAYFLTILSSVTVLLPVIAALFNRKHLDQTLKIAAAYFVFCAITEAALEVAKLLGLRNNLPVIHVYILVSVLFFGALYYYAFFKEAMKKAVLVLTGIALLIIILNVIFNEGIMEYPSLSNTVLSVLLICLSLAYFYQLLTRQEFVHIEKQGLFWINAGVLFYFSLNVFLFMLFKRLIVAHQQGYYLIHQIVNIIANILFTAGLLCKPQKTT